MNVLSILIALAAGLAIGFAFGWQERRNKLKLKLSGVSIRDCDGGSPCTTCSNKRQCGKTGCVRPITAAVRNNPQQEAA